MTTLEQALTDTFAGLADEAPHDLGLLSRVQAATSRRTRARRLSYVVSSLAAVALVAVGLTAMPFGEAKADRFTDPTGFLVDNRGAEQRFPFTPSYLPSTVTGSVSLDVYERYGDARYVGGAQLFLSFRLDSDQQALGDPVTVNGRPGVARCAGGSCYVEWQRKPQQYVTVASSSLSQEEVLRIAEGLKDDPMVQRPRIVVGLLPPDGCHLNPVQPDVTSFNPVDSQKTCPVVVQLAATGSTVPPTGNAATVLESSARIGGYTGKLSELVDASLGGRHFFYAELAVPDGRTLVVTTPSDGRWDRDELDRFVRAIVLP